MTFESTLRCYEDIGLLPPADRTAAGYLVDDDATGLPARRDHRSRGGRGIPTSAPRSSTGLRYLVAAKLAETRGSPGQTRQSAECVY
ncbi:MAG: MerR family DNA-binding transcriptional regulator [Acidimicrobiales bacterium]